MSKYDWYEKFDEHDNSIWELRAPWRDEEDRSPLYRLKQTLRANCVQWFDASDEEMRFNDPDDVFESLEQAKRLIEENFDTVEDECIRLQECDQREEKP